MTSINGSRFTLGNLVLQFLQKHHQTLKPHSPEDDTLQKYHNLKREHELLQTQYSASQRSSPPSTMTAHKDDAELVTPPPVNHLQSSAQFSAHGERGSSRRQVIRCSTSATASDYPISSRHVAPPAKQTTSKLLTMHSTPEDIIKHYSWTSDQPRVYLKQAPMPSLIKWANHPSRLNGNKMASWWGLEPGYITKLSDKALCLLIVVARVLTG